MSFRIHFGRPRPSEERAKAIRAALAGRLEAQDSATILPLAAPQSRDVAVISFHAYGLTGPFIIALMICPSLGRSLEVFAYDGAVSRTLGEFPDTQQGRREADAFGAGALTALRLIYGEPAPGPSGPGGSAVA